MVGTILHIGPYCDLAFRRAPPGRTPSESSGDEFHGRVALTSQTRSGAGLHRPTVMRGSGFDERETTDVVADCR